VLPSRLLLWASALALLAAALWLWPDVPARVPVHFGADGAPDRWAERSLWSWFGLPLVGLALAAGLDGVARWAVRHPEMPAVNLPDKAAVLALPPERRAPVLDRVAALLYAVGVTCLFAFALIQVGTWTAAHGSDGAPWVLAGGLLAVVGPLAVLVWGLVRVSAEVRRQREGA
jgi:uncharacterized membrane protein